jgi:hypothetical protein
MGKMAIYGNQSIRMAHIQDLPKTTVAYAEAIDVAITSRSYGYCTDFFTDGYVNPCVEGLPAYFSVAAGEGDRSRYGPHELEPDP